MRRFRGQIPMADTSVYDICAKSNRKYILGLNAVYVIALMDTLLTGRRAAGV
jgi:hypothetical protein